MKNLFILVSSALMVAGSAYANFVAESIVAPSVVAPMCYNYNPCPSGGTPRHFLAACPDGNGCALVDPLKKWGPYICVRDEQRCVGDCLPEPCGRDQNNRRRQVFYWPVAPGAYGFGWAWDNYCSGSNTSCPGSYHEAGLWSCTCANCMQQPALVPAEPTIQLQSPY